MATGIVKSSIIFPTPSGVITQDSDGSDIPFNEKLPLGMKVETL